MRKPESAVNRAGGAVLAATLCYLSAPADAATVAIAVNGGSGGALNAVVYAMPIGGNPPRSAPRSVIMDQINKEFVPFVAPVQAGTSVTFPNKDNIRHHVYSFSPAKAFDLKLYSGVAARPVLFEKPGPVALGCNIHDWMVAYIYVVDSPWFTKTDKAGAASLDLPGGEYDVKVWHPWQTTEAAAQRIKVGAGDARLAFQVDIVTPKQVKAPQ